MKISTKGRYALSIMLDFAQRPAQQYTPLKEAAARQGISKQYLEQIIPLLHSASLLQSQRGAFGGYRLARQAGEITVGEILRITEGNVEPVPCLQEQEGCINRETCLSQYVWHGFSGVIANFVDSITLEDILNIHTQRGLSDYSI